MAQEGMIFGPDRLWVTTQNTKFWEHDFKTRKRIQLPEGETSPELPAGTVVFEEGSNQDYIVAIVPGTQPRIGWVAKQDVVRIENFEAVYNTLIPSTARPSGRDYDHELSEWSPPRRGDHLPTRVSPQHHATGETPRPIPGATFRRPGLEQTPSVRLTQPEGPQYKAGEVYELTQDIQIAKDSGIPVTIPGRQIVKCMEIRGGEAHCMPFIGGTFREDLMCWIPLDHLRVSADQGRSVIFPTEIRTQTPRR